MGRWRLSVALIVLAAGCGQSGPRAYPVSGTISFDGKPVSDGDILFIPADASLGPDAGKIVGGKFTAQAKQGKCRVEISALDIGPDTPMFEGAPIAGNYIPGRYNAESELEVDVLPKGGNDFQFKLRSGEGE